MIIRRSVFVLLLAVLAGHAQSAVRDQRSTAISDDRIRSLIRGIGLESTEGSSGGSTVFSFRLNDHKVALQNRINGMQLTGCIEGVHLDLLKMNQWDREHFSTRGYLDEQGCTALVSEIGFAGGVTNADIVRFVGSFCTNLAIFARFVRSEKPEGSASPIDTMAWTQLGPYAKLTAKADTAESRPGALQINREISFRYDPGQWSLVKSRRNGRFVFSRSSGDGRALVIAERLAIPDDAVRDVALANAQLVDPHARVVFSDKRRVNGVVVGILKIEAAVENIPMIYYGYFYTGESGTVQILTFTEKTRFPEQEQDFRSFLNGLSVTK